jgi:hypothetical protein
MSINKTKIDSWDSLLFQMGTLHLGLKIKIKNKKSTIKATYSMKISIQLKMKIHFLMRSMIKMKTKALKT